MSVGKKNDGARFEFRNRLADGFIHTLWNTYESSLQLEEMFGGNNQAMTPSSIDLTNDGFKMASMIDLSISDDDEPLSRAAKVIYQPVSVMAFLKRNNEDKAGRSYKGMRCQVCLFELRRNVTKDVSFCKYHGLRMCTVVRPLDDTTTIGKTISQSSPNDEVFKWYCPDLTATCWQEAHKFYIPQGLWGRTTAGLSDKFGFPQSR